MRSKLAVIGLSVLAVIAIACGAGGGSSRSSSGAGGQQTVEPVPATTTEPAAPVNPATTVEPAPATPGLLVIPGDLVGQNAQIAYERLENVGFTNILYASADPDDTVVLWPPNWHVVEVEPAAGTELAPDSTIILTCSKQ